MSVTPIVKDENISTEPVDQFCLSCLLHAQIVQDVPDRQNEKGEDVGYCLAIRFRNQMYYNTARGLECKGIGNQCPPAECMRNAVNMFAREGKVAIPTETVRALCKYYFEPITWY